ncbi:MAG: hypothetical protein KatS3mg013_1590 [Actinomycetota bacterium]|jgi:anti-sigma factor RsiW|nr:MAG: hypothetical protein KatS3mg013_1590 [Actinomycetota bacterium]
MTHPEELLAAAADGSLRDPERAELEAHLAGCARCREELDLARRARAALRNLPTPDVPAELGSRVRAEAHARPGWGRWPAAVAGIAAAVLALAIALPRLGGPPPLVADRAGAPEDVAAPAVERIASELEPRDLAELAAAARTSRAQPTAEGAPAVGEEFAAETTALSADEAIACLRTAMPGVTAEPVRLFVARLSGVPAWIGVFVTGADPARPEAVQVVAASRGDCTLLSSAAARL